jgi:hypothetical protein
VAKGAKAKAQWGGLCAKLKDQRSADTAAEGDHPAADTAAEGGHPAADTAAEGGHPAADTAAEGGEDSAEDSETEITVNSAGAAEARSQLGLRYTLLLETAVMVTAGNQYRCMWDENSSYRTELIDVYVVVNDVLGVVSQGCDVPAGRIMRNWASLESMAWEKIGPCTLEAERVAEMLEDGLLADGPFDAARRPLEELLAKLTAAPPAESADA